MRVFWVGYGQAGGKITNALMGMSRKFYDAVAINTEEADLADLDNIREKTLIGKYKQMGRGVGADIEVGAKIAEKALSQMMDRIDLRSRRFDPEAFWVVAGMAGGSGAGGAHILAEELREIYHKPVYVLGVLPSATGMPSDKEALYLSNALRCFELWREHFDNILLMDNQQYEQRMDDRESLEGMYQRINENLAKRLTMLLSAGEVRPAPQEVFSSSEVIATLNTGGAVSTIGYHAERIRSKLQFWKEGIEPDTKELERIIAKSLEKSSLTFPCEISGARAAALVTLGKPEHLYTQAIIKGKANLEQMTKDSEVRYGDYPDRRSKGLAVVTIISGIDDFVRLDQMRQRVEELRDLDGQLREPVSTL